jgi:hypothetical protein
LTSYYFPEHTYTDIVNLIKKLSLSLTTALGLLFVTAASSFACTVSISPSTTTPNTNHTIALTIHNNDSDFYNVIKVHSSNPTMSNQSCAGNTWCNDNQFTTFLDLPGYGTATSTYIYWSIAGGSINDVTQPGNDLTGLSFTFNGNLPTTFTITPDKDGTDYSTCTTTLTSSVASIAAFPSSSTVTVGTPFTVDVAINAGQAFNAAQATVAVSPNLAITSLSNPSSNACNFNYTQIPTTSNPSFAGAIFGTSTVSNCTVYRMSLTPTSTGTGTVTLSNGSIKSYADSTELLSNGGLQNGSFTITAASPTPTPPGTTLVTVDDSVQGSNQNQWNYVGNWSHCTDSSNPACNPNLYNNSVSWDNTTDDYATLSFTGRQVLLYGLVDPNHGIAGVSIDGGAETTVDFYSATRNGNVLVWASPILTAGQHTLKVRVTGEKNSSSGGAYLALDRADIQETTPSNLTITNTVFATYNSSFTLMGTKDTSITSVLVNGSSSNSTYPTSTTWQAVEPVSLGNNNFTVYGTDANSNQTASITVSINRHMLGDINGDGVVDLIDASLFATDWGKTGNLTNPLSDMNGDGAVDLTDYSILAKLEQ